jgi:phosphoglycerate dehydrogenase-like enzyme
MGAALEEAGLAVDWVPKRGERGPAEVARLVAGATGAIVSTDPFDASVFAAAPELRVISRVGVGVDSIDLAAATAAGVVVTVTPGCNERTVADHTLAMILGVVRRLLDHDASVRAGCWPRGGEMTGGELDGMTVGVIGHGQIGSAVVRRLRGFDARVLVCDPRRSAVDGCEVVALDELLARAQVVTLHLPLQPATRALIGARELALMRPDAILVNTSRGGLVDERALVHALRSGRPGAAALDVFEREPPAGSPLLRLNNVLLSSHVAGLSTRSVARMTAKAARNLVDVLRGHPNPAVVANPAVLEHDRWQMGGRQGPEHSLHLAAKDDVSLVAHREALGLTEDVDRSRHDL